MRVLSKSLKPVPTHYKHIATRCDYSVFLYLWYVKFVCVLMRGNQVRPWVPAYLATFSVLMEHFQMAPVAAARSCLLSALLSREISGFRPLYLRTRSRVCLSSAHCKAKQRLKIYINACLLMSMWRQRNLRKIIILCAFFQFCLVFFFPAAFAHNRSRGKKIDS